MMFSSPRATETYCRDETDPILLTGVSDSVADYEIGEMAKWRIAAPGKTAWDELKAEFENEVRMLRRLRHPNIIITIILMFLS